MAKITREHPEICINIEEMANNRRRIVAIPNKPDIFVAKTVCETTYTLDLIHLIYEVKGPAWLCDEIIREGNGSRTGFLIQKAILAYVPESSLRGKRILDFGCGAGSSTMWFARLFPESEIVGVDLEERLLQIARQRASHYSYKNISFVPSPSGAVLPELKGFFDFVVLPAVYEDLLTRERKEIFPHLYSRLKWYYLHHGDTQQVLADQRSYQKFAICQLFAS